jgi:ubiquinone/menaquinone biosynthesis C-methylase UbiE
VVVIHAVSLTDQPRRAPPRAGRRRSVPAIERAGHDQVIDQAFTQQATAFNESAVANSATLLDAILDAATPVASERWLEAACGPGIISRGLAPLVAAVHGVDITAAMVELARAQAAAAGLDNVTFEAADATATGLETASFDGAVTRFSVHHLPIPARLFDELARLVRPGGTAVVVDHLADGELEPYVWSQELERLRDPSHWASLSAAGLRALGDRAGFVLEREDRFPLGLDFDDWLHRGTADPAAWALVERLLAQRPGGTECFAVSERDGARILTLQIWLGRWRRG